MKLFLDTGVLLAAALVRDPDHAKAVAVLRRAVEGEWSGVVTSDFVLAEAFNFVRMKVKRREAAEGIVKLVFGTEEIPAPVDEVLRVHSGRFAQALDLYRKEFDRGLSLTDWTSVVLAREMGIGEIATFDGGFKGVLRIVSPLDSR